jgi:two-component system nitrogen regulation response regulator GlnG
MPLEAQTRLLRVLQQGEYTTVGGTTPIKTNVRVIAATHRDLRLHISQGLFREDLFFRLNVVPLRLPPLRERLGDLPDLVRHFLDKAVREGLPRKEFSAVALTALAEYRWPGNVRELENLVKRLLAMEVDDAISAAAVSREIATLPVASERSLGTVSDLSVGEFMENHLVQYFASFGSQLPPKGLYDKIIAEIEPPLLRATLAATRGNQIKAAELLGLNRNTLRSKLRERKVVAIRGVG